LEISDTSLSDSIGTEVRQARKKGKRKNKKVISKEMSKDHGEEKEE